MTAVNRTESGRARTADLRPARGPVEVAAEPVCLRVRWAVSAEAWRTARPDVAIDPKSQEVWVEWSVPALASVDRDHRDRAVSNHNGADHPAAAQPAAATCELIDPSTGTRTLLATAQAADERPARWRTDGDLRHIAVDDDLDLTVRAASGPTLGDPVQILYARTTMLARLGLPGGRYEIAGARWDRH